MSNSKIKNFPISYSERRKNTLGPLQVECEVSGRVLKFQETSSLLQGGEFISIDVLPIQMDDDKPPRKLCSLIVTRENLLRALTHVHPENDIDKE